MSKRKREAVEKSVELSAKGSEISETSESSGSQNNWRKRWEGLTFQNKILAMLVIGMLGLGTFGAGLKYLDDHAKRTVAARQSAAKSYPPEEGILEKINPFVPPVMPAPATSAPQLSKEYVYAGSRLLAIESDNGSAALSADLAVWRPSTGVWWVMGGTGSQQVSQNWGSNGDKPVPGDYDGDGKTDFAVFRPDSNAHTGIWYVFYSGSNSWTSSQFGNDTDKTTPADYDGDGKTDIAVWRASDGVWYILRSSDGGISYIHYGANGDEPSPADYDGDGKADAAVWRNADTTFYSRNSSDQANRSVNLATNSTEPVSADYDGDGKADYSIRSGNNWIILNSSNNQTQTIPWQQGGDKAVHNDYDGDGKVDIAVWKNSNGNWYIRQSKHIGQSSELRQVQWGQAGDIPVPAFFKR